MKTMKRGDTFPDLEAQLISKAGVTLTGATVVMNMRNAQGVTAISRQPVSVVDAATMKVSYEWQAGDTDVPGLYHIEFEVEFPDGKIGTFPSNGFVHLTIEGDIA